MVEIGSDTSMVVNDLDEAVKSLLGLGVDTSRIYGYVDDAIAEHEDEDKGRGRRGRRGRRRRRK